MQPHADCCGVGGDMSCCTGVEVSSRAGQDLTTLYFLLAIPTPGFALLAYGCPRPWTVTHLGSLLPTEKENIGPVSTGNYNRVLGDEPSPQSPFLLGTAPWHEAEVPATAVGFS